MSAVNNIPATLKHCVFVKLINSGFRITGFNFKPNSFLKQTPPFPGRYASLCRALYRVLLWNYPQTTLFSLGINKGNKLILLKLIFRFNGIFLNLVHMYCTLSAD